MTEIPAFSPGCFGSAIAFKKDDTVCHGCKFAVMCEPAHLEAQQALRVRFGIKTTQETLMVEKQKKHEAKAAEPVDPSLLTVPKKVRDLLARLDRGNYDVVGKLKNGINPFGRAIPFMAITCHLLLNGGRPLDREFLTAAFEKKLGWQKNTAEAHVRMAFQALTHVGAIENRDGLISLRRS